MAGDVNLFLTNKDDLTTAEIEVMIAGNYKVITMNIIKSHDLYFLLMFVRAPVPEKRNGLGSSSSHDVIW